MSSRIQKKPLNTHPLHTKKRGKPPTKLKTQAPSPAPAPIAMPVPDKSFYGNMARCHMNTLFYRNLKMELPFEKTIELERRYETLWANITVPQYTGEFTEAAYIEKFGPSGQGLYGKVWVLNKAALPGDNSMIASFALTALHNTVSALLFSDQIAPEKIMGIVTEFEAASRNQKPGEGPNSAALETINANFKKLNIPAAFHTLKVGGVEAICMKRYYK